MGENWAFTSRNNFRIALLWQPLFLRQIILQSPLARQPIELRGHYFTRSLTLRPRDCPKVQRNETQVGAINFTIAVKVTKHWIKFTHVQQQNANVALVNIAV